MKRNWICVINKVIKIKWECEGRKGGWIDDKGSTNPQKGTLSEGLETFFSLKVWYLNASHIPE